MPEATTSATSRARSRSKNDVALTDFDEQIASAFKGSELRPSATLVRRIRSDVLRKALEGITPASVAPYLHEEVARLAPSPGK